MAGGSGLPAANGTAASPSINFTNSTGTGLYRAGSNILGFSTSGNEVMRIDATGSVGIGTTAMNAYFNVQASGSGTVASAQFMQPALASGNSNYLLLGRSAAANESGVMGYDHNTTVANRSIQFSHYGQAAAMVIRNGGNVGIGTTSPARPLDVNGAVHLSPVANPTTPAAGDMYIDGGAANALRYYNGSAWITVGNANSAAGSTGQIQYNNAGSLAGNSGFSYSGAGAVTITGAAPTALSVTTSSTNGIVVSSGNTGITASGLLTGIVGQANSSGYGVNGINLAMGDGIRGEGNGGNGGNFISDSGTGGRFTSNTGYALITEKGNVGIGSTSPLYKFQVAGGSAAGLFTTTDFTNTTTGSSLALGFGANTGNTYAFLQANSTGGSVAANLNLNPTGGNVSIGSTVSNGHLTVTPNSSSSSNLIYSQATPGNGGAIFRVDQYGVTYAPAFNSGNGPRMEYDGNVLTGAFTSQTKTWITSGSGSSTAYDIVLKPSGAGMVGIGTTTPAAKLDVAGNVKLGTTGTAFTASGVCTAGSTVYTAGTPVTFTCSGVPASTNVAVNCSPSGALAGYLTARATGTLNQIAITSGVSSTYVMTCMWMAP